LAVLNRLVYTYHNVAYNPAWRLKTILFAYKTMYPTFDDVFANKLMHYFELNGKMKYKGLSQGMASIFNFLCALACRAPLTMLDEPVLGMDVTVRAAAYEILLREYTEHPRTIIVSSHLLAEIEGLLSDILLIEQGNVIINQPIEDMQQSAYRVDGTPASIDAFTSGKNIIHIKTTEISSLAIVYAPCTDEIRQQAQHHGLTLSAVRPQELCVYLTQQNKEDELACLW